jgi:hypothetical protein
MASPFPGMDPYLEQEALWPTFHRQFVQALCQALHPLLLDRYRARVSRRQYTTEQVIFTSILREEKEEDFIEVRRRGDSRLVCLVDVPGPANKLTARGRQAYHETRQQARAAGAALVEIDLVLQGKPLLDFNRDTLGEWDYAVSVTRASQPDVYEVYTTTLPKRIQRFRLPLASEDRDVVLDLHPVYARCYEACGFDRLIDYSRDPLTTLDDDDRTWLHDLLKQQKRR